MSKFTVECEIDGKPYSLTPNFKFVEAVRKATGFSSLLEIAMAVSRIDPVVTADIIVSASRANGFNGFTNAAIGELLMTNGISFLDNGDDVGGKGLAIVLLNNTIAAFANPKESQSEKLSPPSDDPLGDAIEHFAEFAFGVLHWSPSDFWHSTPWELYRALEGWKKINGVASKKKGQLSSDDVERLKMVLEMAKREERKKNGNA